MMGYLGKDPELEYWDATKMNSIRMANGDSVTTPGLDLQVENWLSCNGKRVIQRNTRTATNFVYSTNTFDGVLSIENGNSPGTRTLMTHSTYIFDEGVTFFYVFQVMSTAVSLGPRNTIPTGNSYLGYATTNGEFIFTKNNVQMQINDVRKSLTLGSIGAVFPVLLVYGLRIFQSGTSVIAWAVGGDTLVKTTTWTTTNWLSNVLCSLDTSANVLIHYIELNRDIKTTAQMKTRRDELFNRFV